MKIEDTEVLGTWKI